MSRKPPKGKGFEVTVPAEFREYYRSLDEDEEMKKSIDSLVESLEMAPLKAGAFVPKDRVAKGIQADGVGERLQGQPYEGRENLIHCDSES
jgi:hypothetical protein